MLTWIGIKPTSSDNHISRLITSDNITATTTLEELGTKASENYIYFDMDVTTSFRKMMRVDGDNDKLTPCRVWRPVKIYKDAVSTTDFITPPIFDIVEPYPIPIEGDDNIF